MNRLRLFGGLLMIGFVCRSAAAQTLTTLASFNGANGSFPAAGLIADAQGNLYGTTFHGGDYMAGSVFRIGGITHSLTTVASFNGTDGARPQAALLLDATGNLYGTTTIGGDFGWGTVFQVSATTHQITDLHSFNSADGGYPLSSLTADANGSLYGTTYTGGGANIHGTLFSIPAGFGPLVTLVGFDGTNGQAPLAGLISAPDGNFYGTTAANLFKLSASDHMLTPLAWFGGNFGGPPGALIADAGGNLYGATRLGGPSNDGTIFEYVSSTQSLVTLASFGGANGSQPEGGLIRDANGIFYGTTLSGGAYGDGSVFKFDPSTGVVTTLASFNGGDLTGPMGGLVFGADGNLYGTTWGGGDNGMGTVFEVSVPEPGSIGLSLLAVTVLLCRRREIA